MEHALQGADLGAWLRAESAGDMEIPAHVARGRVDRPHGASVASSTFARWHHRSFGQC